ncbi:isopullulanase-like [Haliotis rubra]|uniref:isopullulanase-like n=1 Tax=Haliotis rubra TaxID=36100 RepID=UPI001EE5EED9|nr:isopullulanase-like [Haliotis rubra]
MTCMRAKVGLRRLKSTQKVKDFHRCTVRPRSYSYRCQRSGQKTATFHINKALKMMSVEFDYDTGDGYATDIRDKLFIFADPPEGETPNPHDHGVLYYEPGEHKLGGTKTIDCKSGIKEIYLAPGSYLHGALDLRCDGIRLHGRGIVSTEMFAHKSDAVGWAIIQGDAGHTTVEGITMVDPAKFYYRLLHDHNVVRNAKMVAAWTGNTDGVAQGDYGLLEDTFIIADDASVKFHGDHLKIQRLVIWQMQNGGVFLTGYDTERVDDVSVEDCDVIHTDWCDFKGRCLHVSGNDAVIDNSGTKHFHISNIHFKDIRVEGLVQRIVRYAFLDDADGTVSHVIVENLSVDEQPLHDQMHNELSGSKNGRIVDWKFIDLTIGGHCVNN